MPLKLNVGVSKKVGLPDYGSAGATCNIELELDTHLLENDLDGFHERVRSAYVAAQQAVQDQLLRLQGPPARALAADGEDGRQAAPANGHGHAVNGKVTRTWGAPAHTTGTTSRAPRPATPGQVRAIYAIARQAGVDLDALLSEQGVSRPEGLGAKAASALIDQLKEAAV